MWLPMWLPRVLQLLRGLATSAIRPQFGRPAASRSSVRPLKSPRNLYELLLAFPPATVVPSLYPFFCC
jgi:hypothetical protein